MLTAIGTPLQRPDGSYFDGKIGSWPVAEQAPARRNSINRPAGALETKPISMTSAVYVGIWNRAGGIHFKIREKLYQLRTSGIIIQQDGAKAHIGHDSVNVINQYIQQGGWNSILVNQPAQSPDLKMLDLG
jgi:hypothetical protein